MKALASRRLLQKRNRTPSSIRFVSKLVSDYGGERGIRTLERVLAVTRFPIVRLRPTQPSLHIHFSGHFGDNERYYTRFFSSVNPKFSFYFAVLQKITVLPSAILFAAILDAQPPKSSYRPLFLRLSPAWDSTSYLEKTKHRFFNRCFVFGGERGIRTLERVLAVTRFPIVRLRPTQPSLHFNFTCRSVTAKRIITAFSKVSTPFLFFIHVSPFPVFSSCCAMPPAHAYIPFYTY